LSLQSDSKFDTNEHQNNSNTLVLTMEELEREADTIGDVNHLQQQLK
jgi:hypothetical protein